MELQTEGRNIVQSSTTKNFNGVVDVDLKTLNFAHRHQELELTLAESWKFASLLFKRVL